MEDVTQVSDRSPISQMTTEATRASRRAGWFPRVSRLAPIATQHSLQSHRHARTTSTSVLVHTLPLAAAAPPSSPKPCGPRHDLIALRKACEAQAFSAYAHAHSRKEYAQGDYQRATQWQRQAAEATRGAIMYRELARMLFSAGSD